jgi:membrane-bound ClpP family serine protease
MTNKQNFINLVQTVVVIVLILKICGIISIPWIIVLLPIIFGTVLFIIDLKHTLELNI